MGSLNGFPLMRHAALALLLPLLQPLITTPAVHAQVYDLQATSDQQQILQNLLNNAIVAVRQNDQATACSLRGQALTVLNANLAAFQAVFPANNWSDLQVSLQGSLRKCAPPPSAQAPVAQPAQ